MNDDVSITALLHKYGALAFWDYAAAAPYVKIDMNPKVLYFIDDFLVEYIFKRTFSQF